MKHIICQLVVVLALFIMPFAGTTPTEHTLVIVIDGLRPDYIQPELMPTLHKLKSTGTYFSNHHSVFPTVTRVNSTSISTGCYPAKHGVMGNTVYFPEVDPKRGLNTGDYKNLIAIDEATGGNLVTAKTTGEYLQDAGKKLVAVSSGSTGSAFLLNHKISGGALLQNEVTLPESLTGMVEDILGPPAEDGYPGKAKVSRCADAYLKIALDKLEADVVYMWLTDPDHTAHRYGIGHPTTNESIKHVDDTLQVILNGLKARDMLGSTNILITADHGFSTYAGKGNPLFTLRDITRELRLNPNDVIQVGTAIYLQGEAKQQQSAFAAKLLTTDWVGAVFSAPESPGSSRGLYPGTLSTELIHWNHDRSGQILFSADWDDSENEFGYIGASLLKAGGAGHGSSSAWDIHIPLIAHGPAFQSGVVMNTPSSNVDLAPTTLHLQGLPYPEVMDGRILSEAFTGAALVGEKAISQSTFGVTSRNDTGDQYVAVLEQTEYQGHAYVNQVKATRK